MTFSYPGIALLVSTWAGACAVDQPAAVFSPVRTDSAGIEIIFFGMTNGDPTHVRSYERSFRIAVEDRPELMGVSTVRQTPDGDVVAASSRFATILILDSLGQYLRSVGRPGEGPGEFGSVSDLFVQAGGINAYDRRLSRLTLHSFDGQLNDTQNLAAMTASAPGTPLLVDVRGDTLILQYVLAPGAAVGVIAPDVTLVSRTRDSTLATLDSLRGSEFLVRNRGSGFRAYSVPLGRELLVFAAPRGIIVVDTNLPEARYYSRRLELLRLVRFDVQARRTGDAEIRTYIDSAVSEYDDRVVRYATKEDMLLRPANETVPPISAALVGSSGELWIRLRSPLDGNVYHVIDDRGSYQGIVRLPEGAELLDGTEEAIVYIQRGGDGEIAGLVIGRAD